MALCDGLCGSGLVRAIALHRQVQRIGRIKLAAHRSSLGPFGRSGAHLRQHFLGDGLEAMRILAVGVDFHQLEADGLAFRMLLERLAQDFLGLHVAAVSDVDIGLRDRIDFIALVAAADAEIGPEHAVLRRIDALAAGCAEQRIGPGHHRAFLRQQAVLEAVCLFGLLLAPAIHRQAAQQRHRCAAQAQYHRIAQQRREERLIFDRRLRRHHHRRLLGHGDGSRSSRNRRGRGGNRRRRTCRCRRSRCGRGRLRRRGSRSRCRRGLRRRSRSRWCRCVGRCHCRRGRRRRGARGRLAVGRLGELGILHFDQALHLGEVLLQLRHARLHFLERAFLGNQLLVACGGRGADLAGTLRLGQAQFVALAGGRRGLILHAGRHAAALLPGRIGIRRGIGLGCGGQAAAVAGKAGSLRDHLAACLARRHLLRVGCRRDRQHGTGAQAVDIAADECFRIVAVQREQHLVQRHGVLALHGIRCNVIETVATLYGVRPAGGGIRCCGRIRLRAGSLARRTGCALRSGRGSLRLRRCRGVGHAWRGGLHHRRRRKIPRRVAGARGVQQEGIGTRDAAGRPGQVDQDIDERLGNRLGGNHPHHVAAARLAHERGPQRRNDRIVGQAGALVSIRRGQLGDQILGLFLGHAGQIDIGLQRLSQTGTHVQSPKACRMRDGLDQQQACRGNRDSRPARTAMGRFSPAVLAHPHLRLRDLFNVQNELSINELAQQSHLKREIPRVRPTVDVNHNDANGGI